MVVYIVLAFLNGAVISSTRALNGQLNTSIGSFRVSVWNHVVGFVFLTPVLVLLGGFEFAPSPAPPPSAYLDRVLGAFFVAVTSYVFSRLGALNAGVLIIAGQMISAVVLDTINHHTAPSLARSLGVVIVLLGIYCAQLSAAR